MKALGRKAVVCFLALFAVGVSAVIEKKRREEDNRHDLFTKIRAYPMHHTVKKVLPESMREDFAWGTSYAKSHSKWNVRHRRHRSDNRWFGGLGWNVGGENSWWKGPNVCIRHKTHEETDESEEIYDDQDVDKGKSETKNGNHTVRKIEYNSVKMSRRCDNTGTAYKCTNVRGVNGKLVTSVKIYECCPGYERKNDAPGCLKAFDVTDLMSTFERLKVTQMESELKKSGLKDLDRQNYTVFAPTNNAFDKSKDKDASIMGHVVKGVHRTIDFDDEQLLDTQLPLSAIRINKYIIDANNIVTANCVPLVVKDVPATQGIVHVVQKMLPTVTKNLDELVSQIPQLTQLSKVIKQLQLSDRGRYTLFAPTDAAFQNVKPSLRDKIFKGHQCGIEILRQHVLPSVFCASVVDETESVTTNVRHRLFTLDRESVNLTVNGASVVESDIMGTNGVMHIVDQVLIPKKAGDILDVLNRSETRQFLQLITDAGLTDRLQNMNNFTVFAPTNDALKAFSDNFLNSLRKNSKHLENMCSYHVVPERISYQNLDNDMQLPTLDGNNEILVKSYESFPFASVKTVQCAPIVQSRRDSCDNIVHVVSRVLQPPSGDVLYVLKKDPNFSLLVALVESFNLEKLFKTNDPLTFFAPTNKAFDSLSAAAMKHLRQDLKTFTGIVKSHMLADVLCCGGIFEDAFPFSSSEVNLDDWNVTVQKDDEILFNGVPVTSCDQTATNGVVHSIDRFVPEALRRYGIARKATSWKRLLRGSDFID